MNPFDEQNQKLIDEAHVKIEELKLRKLYTWHDIELREKAVKSLTEEVADLKCKDDWNWPCFFAGLGVGLLLSTVFSIIIHNL